MSASGTSILLARQLGALRAHGWSTLDALALVTDALPAGAAKASCEHSLATLRAGSTDAAPSGTPLEQACRRGDASTADTFAALAEALETREAAELNHTGAARLTGLFLAGPLAVGTVLGWLLPRDLWNLGFGLPAPTELALGLLDILRFAGLPLALGAVLASRWLSRGYAPGARALRTAAALSTFAADSTGSTGLPELAPLARQYFEWRRALVGPAAAARELAQELSLDARRQASAFESVVPIAAAVVSGVFMGGVLLALYLPIFSIAGAIT